MPHKHSVNLFVNQLQSVVLWLQEMPGYFLWKHNRWMCQSFCPQSYEVQNGCNHTFTTSHLDVKLFCCTDIYTSQYTIWLILGSTVTDNLMLSIRSNTAELRHPVSNQSTAFWGLFTSGIKSAYDIETSGWLKLSQGAGTADTQTIGLQKPTKEACKGITNAYLKNRLIEGNLCLQLNNCKKRLT